MHPTDSAKELCDHKAAEIIEASEYSGNGHFFEVYECPCGAKGRISGQEDEPPQNWTRTGEVFAE
jgi:hypothetical protein